MDSWRGGRDKRDYLCALNKIIPYRKKKIIKYQQKTTTTKHGISGNKARGERI